MGVGEGGVRGVSTPPPLAPSALGVQGGLVVVVVVGEAAAAGVVVGVVGVGGGRMTRRGMRMSMGGRRRRAGRMGRDSWGRRTRRATRHPLREGGALGRRGGRVLLQLLVRAPPANPEVLVLVVVVVGLLAAALGVPPPLHPSTTPYWMKGVRRRGVCHPPPCVLPSPAVVVVAVAVFLAVVVEGVDSVPCPLLPLLLLLHPYPMGPLLGV